MGSGLFRYSLLTGELTQYKMLVDNTVVYPYQILRNLYVRTLLVHGDFLYVGTADGLEVFTLSKGGDIRLRGRFMLKSSVRDMKVDADGVLWAATTLGLVRFDIANESVKTYTVEDGLPINSTCSVEIASDGKIWEIDEFKGENEGLVIAEIELEHEDETFALPSWVGKEVTGDMRYYNSYLSQNPYKNWKQ